jgi:hypothetical protein
MSDGQDERRTGQFLALQSFDEYMERFEEFHDLDAGGKTFAKRMELMESDETHTHREKERMLEKRKREIIARIQAEITRLRDEIAENGVWEKRDSGWPERVEVSFRYPDGKRGDIDRCICEEAGDVTAPEGEPARDAENPVEGPVGHADATGKHGANCDLWQAQIATGHLREIEAVTLAGEGLFRERRMNRPWENDLCDAEEDSVIPAGQFLLRCNRVVRLEREMAHLNEYKEEYRNLRSIRDPELRRILTAYHKKINDYRQSVYEELVASGNASARWVSEQKAYQIVRRLYPDAKFQYEPDWLRGQHLDIYVPELHLAIEYQGKQHYEPVEFFGGAEGLKERKMYDRRKRIRCGQHGVTLVRWDYDKPLTEEYFTDVLLKSAGK